MHRQAGVDETAYWDFQPGERVITAENLPGTVEEVLTGPIGGAEVYVVKLDAGLGGGKYGSNELRRSPGATPVEASIEAAAVEASESHVASEDYPELAEILVRRPPPVPLNTSLTSAASIHAQIATERTCLCCSGSGVHYPEGGSWAQGSIHRECYECDGSGVRDPNEPVTPGWSCEASLQTEAGPLEWLDRHWTPKGYTPGSHWSYDWCRFRLNARCMFPKVIDVEGTKQAGYPVWMPEDRGFCPRNQWTEGPMSQKACPVSEPGPHSNEPNARPECTKTWAEGGQHGGVPGPLPPGLDQYAPPGQTVGSVTPVRITSQDEREIPDECPGGGEHIWAQDEDRGGKLISVCEKCGQRPGQKAIDSWGEGASGDDHDSGFGTTAGKGWPETSTCKFCKEPAEKGLLWAEGMAYIPVCAGHEQKGRDVIERDNNDEVVGEHAFKKTALTNIWPPEPVGEQGLPCPYCNGIGRGGVVAVAWNDNKCGKCDGLGRLDARMKMGVMEQIEASWADVRAKAKQIREDGGVRIISSSPQYIVGEVKGDHGIYQTQLEFVPGTHQIALSTCSCPWQQYRWARSGRWKPLEGRSCSHIAALAYEAQSRGMFGREVAEDVKKPKWESDPTIPVHEIGERYKSPDRAWRLASAAVVKAKIRGIVRAITGFLPGGMLQTDVGPVHYTECLYPTYDPRLGLDSADSHYGAFGTGDKLYVVVGPIGSGERSDWELHIAGCGDLSQPKYRGYEDRTYEIRANSAREAADDWIDEEMREMGYSVDEHMKIFPCAVKGIPKVAPPAKPVDPTICPGTGGPFAVDPMVGGARRMYAPCPVCGVSFGTGRGVVPRHKKKPEFNYGTIQVSTGPEWHQYKDEKHIARQDREALCGAGRLEYVTGPLKKVPRGMCPTCLQKWEEASASGTTAALITEAPDDIAQHNEAIFATGNPPEGSDLIRVFAITPAGDDFFAGEADDISRAYRDLPMVDPSAVPLWNELGLLVRAQAAALRAVFEITVYDDHDPYQNSDEMHADIDQGLYKVTSLHSHHPVWDAETNVAFRIAHDILGHGVAGSDFSFKGEVEAYQAECEKTPEHLWPVLFTEIVAQSAYANTHHLFGEQKVGLLSLSQEEIDADVGKVMDAPDPAYDAIHRSAVERHECEACGKYDGNVKHRDDAGQWWHKGCADQQGVDVVHKDRYGPDESSSSVEQKDPSLCEAAGCHNTKHRTGPGSFGLSSFCTEHQNRADLAYDAIHRRAAALQVTRERVGSDVDHWWVHLDRRPVGYVVRENGKWHAHVRKNDAPQRVGGPYKNRTQAIDALREYDAMHRSAADKTPCQTPGAHYDTDIGEREVSIKVETPFDLELSSQEAATLDSDLHNAMELVMAPVFTEHGDEMYGEHHAGLQVGAPAAGPRPWYNWQWRQKSKQMRSAPGAHCEICHSKTDLTVDHKWGEHTDAGLRVLCRHCNSSRGAAEQQGMPDHTRKDFHDANESLSPSVRHMISASANHDVYWDQKTHEVRCDQHGVIGKVEDDEDFAKNLHHLIHTHSNTPEDGPHGHGHEVHVSKLAAGEANSTGVMVALVPPEDVGLALLQAYEGPNPEPLEEQHITLLYLGKTDGIDQAKLQRTVEALAQESAPLVGHVGGWAEFINPTGRVTVALWDIRHVEDFVSELRRRLNAAGIPNADNHGYTAHETVGYHDDPVPIPNLVPEGDVNFDSVVIAYGGQWTWYRLGSGEAQQSQKVADWQPSLHSVCQNCGKQIYFISPGGWYHVDTERVDCEAPSEGFDVPVTWASPTNDMTTVGRYITIDEARAWGRGDPIPDGVQLGVMTDDGPVSLVDLVRGGTIDDSVRDGGGPGIAARLDRANLGAAIRQSDLAALGRSQVDDALIFEGEEAVRHEEPEPALPTTDGGEIEPLPDSPRHSPEDGTEYAEDLAGRTATVKPGDSSLAWLMGGTQDHSNSDIAGMAKRFLKEGAKVFSPEEQRALINEGLDEGVVARNLDDLEISGTHYEALDQALRAAEELDDAWLG